MSSAPPSTNPNNANWVVSTTTDPDRRNVRILATTGGYSDNGTGVGNQFINIMAFLTTDLDFIGTVQPNGTADQSSYSRTVGFINGGLESVRQNPGETIVYNQGTDPVLTDPDGSNLTTVLGHRPILSLSYSRCRQPETIEGREMGALPAGVR